MRCPLLWGPIPLLSGHPVPPEPGSRAALSLSFGDAHNLAIVTNAYHTVRRRASWRLNAEHGQFAENLLIWQRHLVASRNRFADISYDGVPRA